jgi:hypothetical protein
MNVEHSTRYLDIRRRNVGNHILGSFIRCYLSPLAAKVRNLKSEMCANVRKMTDTWLTWRETPGIQAGHFLIS